MLFCQLASHYIGHRSLAILTDCSPCSALPGLGLAPSQKRKKITIFTHFSQEGYNILSEFLKQAEIFHRMEDKSRLKQTALSRQHNNFLSVNTVISRNCLHLVIPLVF